MPENTWRYMKIRRDTWRLDVTMMLQDFMQMIWSYMNLEYQCSVYRGKGIETV